MSLHDDIVSHAVAQSKDKRTRALITIFVIVTLLALIFAGWAALTAWQTKKAQAEAGADLASKVQAACNDSLPDSVSLQRLCGLATQVTQKGTPGDAGPQGPAGPPGLNGSDGVDGSNGLNGKDGKNGQNGTNGTNGVNGKDGPPGPAGPVGPKGDPGTNGTNGTDATPFTFSFTINGPGNQSATYSCTVTAPDTIATCTRTDG